MSKYTIDLDLATVDTDGVFDGIAGAGPWTSADFNVGNPPDSLAHQLSFVASADISSLVFTITGTDADGVAISETVTAVDNITPVETAKYYKTITGLSVDSTTSATTVDVGWVDEAVSKLYDLSPFANVPAGTFQVDVTGTIDLDIQFCIVEPNDYADQTLIPWIVDADLDGESADVVAFISEPGYFAFRILINSYSTAAEVQVYTNQPVFPGY